MELPALISALLAARSASAISLSVIPSPRSLKVLNPVASFLVFVALSIIPCIRTSVWNSSIALRSFLRASVPASMFFISASLDFLFSSKREPSSRFWTFKSVNFASKNVNSAFLAVPKGSLAFTSSSMVFIFSLTCFWLRSLNSLLYFFLSSFCLSKSISDSSIEFIKDPNILFSFPFNLNSCLSFISFAAWRNLSPTPLLAKLPCLSIKSSPAMVMAANRPLFDLVKFLAVKSLLLPAMPSVKPRAPSAAATVLLILPLLNLLAKFIGLMRGPCSPPPAPCSCC